jgi:hypothetical protein
MELAEGSVHGDQKLTRRGYLHLMKAKDGWREFNLFTAGYAMSRLPFTDGRYADAVGYQWQNLDARAGEKVDRRTAAYESYMAKETTTGPKRACWNSWIAPHNFEGFFLNMGDMIVKQGDPAPAPRVRQRQAVEDVRGVAVPARARRADREGGRERRTPPQRAARREDADNDGRERLRVRGLTPAVTCFDAPPLIER